MDDEVKIVYSRQSLVLDIAPNFSGEQLSSRPILDSMFGAIVGSRA